MADRKNRVCHIYYFPVLISYFISFIDKFSHLLNNNNSYYY